MTKKSYKLPKIQLIQPKISEQINTPEHSLIKISLGANTISPGILKNNKPKQAPKMYSKNISSTENKISTSEIQLNNSIKISEIDENKTIKDIYLSTNILRPRPLVFSNQAL